MDLDVRSLTADDLDLSLWVDGAAFSDTPTAADREQVAATAEWDLMLGAYAGDEAVGIAGAFAMELTLPGGGIVPAAGVTAVGVLPTHRRRGVLNALMDRQLDDLVASGYPVAILTASEATIYRRYGYGLATMSRRIEIARHRAGFIAPLGRDDVPDPVLRLLDREAAAEAAPAWFDRFRRSQAGEVSRPDSWWSVVFGEHETWKGGGPQFVVSAEDATGDGGYAIYRVKRDATNPTAGAQLEVREVVAASPAIATALWRYLLDVDLVDVVVAEVGVDDPIRWRLADLRALRVVKESDMLWARVLDVPAALSARRYPTEGELVIDVVDGFRPATSGRYRVAGGPEGATVEVTTAAADLVMDVAELGTLLLGGLVPSTLARAGRIEERTAGAVAVADRFFAAPGGRPCCTTHF